MQTQPQCTCLAAKPLPNGSYSLIQIHFIRLHAGLVPRLIRIPSVDGKLLDTGRCCSCCLRSPTHLYSNSSKTALRSLQVAFSQTTKWPEATHFGWELQDPSLLCIWAFVQLLENPAKDLLQQCTLAHATTSHLSLPPPGGRDNPKTNQQPTSACRHSFLHSP